MGGEAVASLGINPQFREKAMTLIGASGAWNSIRVHRTALNKIKSAELKYSVRLDMPWLTKQLLDFALCCASDGLRASTVRNYVSQVKKAHIMSNFPWQPDMVLFNALVKGLENTLDPSRKRIAVTPRMLMAFREKLVSLKSSWSRHDRRAMWALITCLWSGSFRSSELLAPSAKAYIEEETFVWGRLENNTGMVEGTWTRWYGIHLLKPKEHRAGKEGVRVELFSIPAPWDPVLAMDKFRRDNKLGEESNLPVFRWKNGENITVRFVNSFIRDCGISLDGYPGDVLLSSHSFRAGIVSLMGAMGLPEALIKSIGRWGGDSWLRYAKSGRSIRKSDQLMVQRKAAEDYIDWSPIPVLVEDLEIGS